MVQSVDRVHPLVDDVEGDVVVSRSDRTIVALTPLRADLLIAVHAAGGRVRLVTPPTSRLTDPLRDALVSAGGSWIVADGAGASWDGLLGLDPATGEPSSSFARPARPETLQLIVTASLRHRADSSALVGPALDRLAQLGEAPGLSGWGPHEPVVHDWDVRTLTRHLASRAPDEARVVVAGPSLIGSTLARRTDKGVEEVLQLLIAAGPEQTSTRALDAVPAVLAALGEDAVPLFALVTARPGRADLTTAPVVRSPPAPVALLIGAPGVRDLGLDVQMLADRIGARVIGRPRVPGVVVPFTGPDGGWAAFERFADVVGRDRLRRVLGGPVVDGAV